MCRGRDKNQSQMNVRLRRRARRGKGGERATIRQTMGELFAEEVPRVVSDYERIDIMAVISSPKFQDDLMSA